MIAIRAPYLEIAVLVLGMAILILETFAAKIDKKIFAYAGIVGLAAVLVASFFLLPESSIPQTNGFWNFYTADPLSIFFKRFTLVTTIVVLGMMIDYTPVLRSAAGHGSSNLGEFFSLPLLTCAGLMYLVSAIDFIFIFVAIELVTISFFVLVSFPRRNPIALEAGVKYLILGALSTAFLVYGITWIFGVTGETNLQRITAAFSSGKIDNYGATFGAVLVLVGLGFKIAAVPFQIWVPDVYQGAPTPVTAFLSVGSKLAGFVLVVRCLTVFAGPGSGIASELTAFFALVAAATLVYGNLGAIPQTNIKRLMGYSSIAQCGYILVGIAAACAGRFTGNATGLSRALFYMAAYVLMNPPAFAVVLIVSKATGSPQIHDYPGLPRRSPLLRAALA